MQGIKIKQRSTLNETEQKKGLKSWQLKIHEIIYEADTFYGKLFDVALLIAIMLSIIAVMLESVPSIQLKYGEELRATEYAFTAFFTLEYIFRIISIGKPLKYVFSFYGIIDLLSILPTYIGFFFSGYHQLSVIRAFRLIRVFRIFKLGRYLSQGAIITDALRASRPKIIVFLLAVLIVCMIMGTTMYLIESPESGFTSIPRSIYWAIVTLTTVGYGDISPETPLGQALASVIMIMGYVIIAVPTGIVGAEISKHTPDHMVSTQTCPSCSQEGHDKDAKHCKYCGEEL